MTTVNHGMSRDPDAMRAIGEATKGWYAGPERYDLVLVFHSSKQNGQKIASTLAAMFPDTPIAGCSTSGEYYKGEHHNGVLTITAVKDSGTKWAVGMLKDIAHVDKERSAAFADRLLATLGISRLELNAKKHFALTFIDGLSLKEESVVSHMVDALEGIPFAGGSAGDDLGFKATSVIANGESATNAAVFVLAETERHFEILKHQHFKPSGTELVMTKVDEATRRVYTMDGYPAAERYAQALGKKIGDLTAADFSLHPLLFETSGEIFVRSIQAVNDDKSLTFYCAIEEGMILSVGAHSEMEPALKRDLDGLGRRFSKVDLFLMCNCILRSLEATSKNHHPNLSRHLRKVATHVVGFDTYGEQLNGLHINQTLVGLALGEKAA